MWGFDPTKVVRLCRSVHPWACVSEIQPVKETALVESSVAQQGSLKFRNKSVLSRFLVVECHEIRKNFFACVLDIPVSKLNINNVHSCITLLTK